MPAVEFLNNLFGRRNRVPSGSLAKQRLQFVLVQDRVKLPPEVMEAIREDIIAVISKYVDIDQDGIEVVITPGSNTDRLTANIPLRRIRD
ncbi:MAG TPA: cell division topological specificity factor MinE [Chloroflexia bacterium]|nr:cell division topological specificity factor MinE [Chloroflexia bacterium]